MIEYDHECQPPPVDIDNPGRRGWYCPECGSQWLFIRKVVGRRVAGAWRPVRATSDPALLRRQLAAVRQAHDWQCDCTPEDPCRVQAALMKETVDGAA